MRATLLHSRHASTSSYRSGFVKRAALVPSSFLKLERVQSKQLCSTSKENVAPTELPGSQLRKNCLRLAGGFMASSAVAACLLLSTPAVSQGTELVRLPASKNPEILAAQSTMLEAWTIVGESYVDSTFNSTDWLESLRVHMTAAYESDSDPSKAWAELDSMLASLGDPYTRRIDAEDYASFRVSTDGELQGIGLLIANDTSSTGHLRVLAPIKGGPADRAGILPGDEVISINGQDTTGWSGEQAAKMLRGEGGTEVRVKLSRRSDGIPGVASRPEPSVEPAYQVKEVAMRREAIAISPVYSTVLQPPVKKFVGDGLDEAASAAPVGYVRLSQFSNNAADDMKRAVKNLQSQGVSRYILDLRSNPGGLVKAGVDIAGMWLDGDQTVFTVVSRDADLPMIQTTENKFPAVAHGPLVVLVNNMSASASEIVSGALHDNHRALVMGDTNTFGKGKIQTVFELQDGSALFVTVAKYQTPDGYDIDHKGIKPDRTCSNPGVLRAPPLRTANYQMNPGHGAAQVRSVTTNSMLTDNNSSSKNSDSVDGSPVLRMVVGSRVVSTAQGAIPAAAAALNDAANSAAASTASDPAASAAAASDDDGSGGTAVASFLPGVPMDSSTERILLDTLAKDKCILAAERYLASLGAPAPEPPPLSKAQMLYLALTGQEDRATF